MGLFGFGKNKKKEEKAVAENKKEEKLSKRSYDRYHVQGLYVPGFGEVLDISKAGAAIKKVEVDEIKRESIDIELENVEVKAKIKRQTLKEVGVNFEDELNTEEIIKKHIRKPKKYIFKNKMPVSKIDFDEDGTLEKIKAVINLMLELDDPNTSVEKFKTHIEALPVLREKILKKANTVESAGKSKIENVTTAITRIGFEETKKVVYNYINAQISLSNENFTNFEHYEFYNILKSSIFKKLAPLFSFRDIRSEGRSLLTTDIIGIELLINIAPKDFKNIYKSPKELYSYTSRIYEEKIFGINFLDVNRDYFVNRLGLFRYLYDGYILAHLSRHPYLEFSNDFNIMLSSRKLRFSYIAYLTILALEFILSKDKKSGTIFLNRLKRFGLDSSKALSFLNETIFEANEILEKLEVENKIRPVSYPNIALGVEKSFGKELHISAFIEKMDFVSKNGVKRIAFRYEDPFCAMMFIDNALNSLEFNFYDLPFCIVPSQNLKDDELKIETFNGFDLVIFKDIEKLPKNIMDDFLKLWKDFEGKIFVTYSAYSMIDFNQKKLHSLFKDYIIEIPSCFDHKYIYKSMLEIACSELNKDLNMNICSVSEFLNDVYSIDSIYKVGVEKFFRES
ncbi:HDOD domain-containing protein [Nitrosophilus labii]|uniref:HDOD domain-containing protein n=1 Tax=Nitrosophilus labii TaxID=2706014 RepID=UPI0016572B5E|nr:HDOD domain-containing protein [Nitrosophilus labii]